MWRVDAFGVEEEYLEVRITRVRTYPNPKSLKSIRAGHVGRCRQRIRVTG